MSLFSSRCPLLLTRPITSADLQEQQDVHEWTTTCREAMRYSAYLRQPADVPVAEKDDYVEEILELLEMQDLADALIGFPGYGLSVEARKRLTIGVELAAKPELLLFLDGESWSI